MGESGCGKSITSRSILRIIKKPGYSEGEIIFNPSNGEPVDLLKLNPKSQEMRETRGPGISMIFQEPMNALSPVHTIGNQLMEAMLIHDKNMTKEQAFERGVELLSKVGISNPSQRMNEYPFSFPAGCVKGL